MYHRRARLEGLEPRHLLSITVNTLVDENNGINVGGVSFRDAVAYAATQPGTDTVEFDPSLVDGVIELLYGQITLNSDVEIVGLGQDQLTIDAHGASRVFVVSSGKAAMISGLTITGGVGAGAGIYAHGNLTLDSVHVTANSASTNSGGGIYVNDTGSLTLLRSTIDNNTANHGGGIYGKFEHADSLYVLDSTISNNTATGGGGGISFVGAASGSPSTGTIINSTISGNSAASSGGVRVANATSELTIVNSTISDNTATGTGSASGGGALVLQSARLTLHNTIVAGNHAELTDSDDLWKLSSATFNPSISSYNLIGIGNGSGLANGTYGNLVGTAASPMDPGFAPLGDYGGPTKSHALLSNSMAIDHGDTSTAVGLERDQRGVSRFINGTVRFGEQIDIGAVESLVTESSSAEAVGTDMADIITITDTTVTITNVFGSIVLDIASANEIVVDGLGGNDTIDASAVTNKVARLYGSEDDDVLIGGAGNDRLEGGQGADIVHGNSGDDILRNGGAGDRLEGGDGNDILQGWSNWLYGDPDVQLIGGIGDDIYEIHLIPNSNVRSVIDDAGGIDTIDLSQWSGGGAQLDLSAASHDSRSGF